MKDNNEMNQVMVLADEVASVFEDQNILVVGKTLVAHMLELASQMQAMKGRDQDIDEAIDAFSKTLAEASVMISSDDLGEKLNAH